MGRGLEGRGEREEMGGACREEGENGGACPCVGRRGEWRSMSMCREEGRMEGVLWGEKRRKDRKGVVVNIHVHMYTRHPL